MAKIKKLKGKKSGKASVGNAKKNKKTGDPESQLAQLGELDGEIDFETLVRKEYMRLHRQYRVMEDARRRIAEKSKGVTLQGHRLIVLQAEKENLETDLMNTDSPAWHAIDKNSIKTILGILEIFEHSQADIDFLMKNVKEMVANVDKITKRLIAQRLKVQALFGFSMTVAKADRLRSKLEDRLYHFTTKFDTRVSMNKSIRDEVNMMLKLRTIFYERLVSMKTQLATARIRMGEVVYIATSAYDSRDDFVFKINILRDKNDKECRQHVLEMKEFTRVLHHDAKLHGFMGLKNKERELMENHQQRMERKNLAKLREMDLTLASYHRSLKQILAMSHFDSMQHLVAHYNVQEQENFTMFQCTTDLNHEVAALKASTVEMQTEIDRMYMASKKQEREWKELLQGLGSDYQISSDSLDSIINLWDNAEMQMGQVIHHLEAVFSCAECSNAPIIRLLGHKTGINPNNALICMNVLESRVSELKFMRSGLEMRRAVELEGSPSTLLKVKATTLSTNQKNKTQGGPYIPQVVVAGRLDGDEDEDNDEDKQFNKRPMSYRDLKDKILEKMVLQSLSQSMDALETRAYGAHERHGSDASSRSSVASVMDPLGDRVP